MAASAGAERGGGNKIIPDTILLDEDEEAYDSTSPLSKELQLHSWLLRYKPGILVFNGKINPRKFIAGYETAMTSAGGDAQTLAESLIMTLEDIEHDWHTSMETLYIHSWCQVKAELLSTFQGYHPGTKTTRDLLNCIQRDDESLSDYLDRLIQIKAQVPNTPEEMGIAAAVEGLAIGQCAAHFARNYPTTVKELFEIMSQ